MKVLIFDLDGVLVDSCNIHYDSLNIAINEIACEKFIISKTEHLDIYNGLNTKTKLKLLQCIKNIWRTDGFKGFYFGIGPNVLRSVGGAILLVSYDEFKVAFNPNATRLESYNV